MEARHLTDGLGAKTKVQKSVATADLILLGQCSKEEGIKVHSHAQESTGIEESRTQGLSEAITV